MRDFFNLLDEMFFFPVDGFEIYGPKYNQNGQNGALENKKKPWPGIEPAIKSVTPALQSQCVAQCHPDTYGGSGNFSALSCTHYSYPGESVTLMRDVLLDMLWCIYDVKSFIKKANKKHQKTFISGMQKVFPSLN
jgi:hypothetical protein